MQRTRISAPIPSSAHTITADAFQTGLIPNSTAPVHSYPLGQPDPVFDPIGANVAKVDPVRAATEVQEIFNSGAALASAYSGEYSLIRSVLFDYPLGTQPPPPTPQYCGHHAGTLY